MGKDDRQQGGPSAPKTGSFSKKAAKPRGVRKRGGGQEEQKRPGAMRSGGAFSFELHGNESGGQTPETSED